MSTSARNDIAALRKDAENGDPRAAYRLAESYRHGRGVDANKKLAYIWYERAAKGGYRRAQYRLGSCLADGRGGGDARTVGRLRW